MATHRVTLIPGDGIEHYIDPSRSAAETIGYTAAIFEAVHGSAPDIAGQNIANPCALILAGGLMLRHLGEETAADRVEKAVAEVIKEGTYVTRDLNPARFVGTKEMTQAIIDRLM